MLSKNEQLRLTKAPTKQTIKVYSKCSCVNRWYKIVKRLYIFHCDCTRIICQEGHKYTNKFLKNSTSLPQVVKYMIYQKPYYVWHLNTIKNSHSII